MINKTNSVKRITADFSPEAYACLERIAKELKVTKAEALRRVIGTTDFILEERNKGWKPKLAKQNLLTESVMEIIFI